MGASMVTVPAQAATVKNGVKCTKANATTKVGSKTYRCAKNPKLMPTVRTWTRVECLSAYRYWKDVKDQYDILVPIAGVGNEETLQEVQSMMTELEDIMKIGCKKGA